MSNYGGTDLPLLQEQLRLAQDNYDDTLALLEIGAASQVEVDQAHQTLCLPRLAWRRPRHP